MHLQNRVKPQKLPFKTVCLGGLLQKWSIGAIYTIHAQDLFYSQLLMVK